MNILSNSPLQKIPVNYTIDAQSNNWFTIPKGLDAGKKMFYYDYNPQNTNEKVILFVHGNPESSYTYRHVRDEILKKNKSARIIAMDHIGFGISDRASYEMIDKHHAYNLSLLIQTLDLQNILLVIHDWGGPIGIGSLIHTPQRVRSIVLMNTTVFPMPKTGYTYSNYPFAILPWALTPEIIPNFLWGGVAGYVVSNASPQGFMKFAGNTIIHLWKHGMNSFEENEPEYIWSQMLRDTQNAKSSKRQVRQTPVWGHGYEYQDKQLGKVSNHAFYKEIQDTISIKWKDIQVAGFFGQWDPCGKQEVIDQWQKALPQISEHLYRYEDVGHFVEEYKGPEIAEKIVAFYG